MLAFYCVGTDGAICKLLCLDILMVNADIIFGVMDNYCSLSPSKYYIYIYIYMCV